MPKEGLYLRKVGLMTGPGVVQIDIAAVLKRDSDTTGHDRAICDHHCGTEGGYACPAGMLLSENKGLKRKDVAPMDKILQAILVATTGIGEFNRQFVASTSFDLYCQIFNVPDNVQMGIRDNLLERDFMVNLFGGNAEMNKDTPLIAQACHETGLRTTLTTTGGILLRTGQESQKFLEGLLAKHVDVLAVTAEFKDGLHIQTLANMTPDQLRQEHTTIAPRLGQAKKGVETIRVLQLQEEHGDQFPNTLLNFVVHREILDKVEKIIETLKELFPLAKINPYPAQSFRKNDTDSLSFLSEDVPALRQFIENRRKEQRISDQHMALRPHYYAMLAAVTETYRNYPEIIAQMLSGEGVWTCFGKPYDHLWGAGRVIQVGASSHTRSLKEFPHAGGFLSCFWDDKQITQTDTQVWNLSTGDIVQHITGGMYKISQTVKQSCRGCLMPRLNGDKPELELGMAPELKDAYLKALDEDVKF